MKRWIKSLNDLFLKVILVFFYIIFIGAARIAKIILGFSKPETNTYWRRAEFRTDREGLRSSY